MKALLTTFWLLIPILAYSQIKGVGHKKLTVLSHYGRIGDGTIPGPLKYTERPIIITVGAEILLLSQGEEESTVYKVKGVEIKENYLYIYLQDNGLALWNKYQQVFSLFIPKENANLILEQCEQIKE